MTEPKPKSIFINQLDGGYTLNLQGNTFYPVKVCVTIEEVNKIVTDFFSNEEVQATTLPQGQIFGAQQVPGTQLGTNPGPNSVADILS